MLFGLVMIVGLVNMFFVGGISIGNGAVVLAGAVVTYIPASIHNEAMLSGAWTSIAQ